MADLEIDKKAIEELHQEIHAGMIISIGRLGERGFQLLRQEVPYETGNLKQGVAPPDIDEKNLTATLVVSARSAQTGGGEGIIHLPSGETHPVKLRPRIAFNYAEVVAKGRPAIKPKVGKALLIEISGPPSGGSYITANGKTFVVRKSAKAVAPNPYDERAAAQLESEAPNIVGAVFEELFN